VVVAPLASSRRRYRRRSQARAGGSGVRRAILPRAAPPVAPARRPRQDPPAPAVHARRTVFETYWRPR